MDSGSQPTYDDSQPGALFTAYLAGDLEAGYALRRRCGRLAVALRKGLLLSDAVFEDVWVDAWIPDTARRAYLRLWARPVLEEVVLASVVDRLRAEQPARLAVDRGATSSPLAALTLGDRAIYVFHAWLELSIEQIAAILDREESEVGRRWGAVMERFSAWPTEQTQGLLVIDAERLFPGSFAPAQGGPPGGRWGSYVALRGIWGEVAMDGVGGRVVGLLASPGLGASTLLRRWLADVLALDPKLRPKRVAAVDLAARDAAAREALIDELLVWFGDDRGGGGRLERLARLVTSDRNLLIVDGVRGEACEQAVRRLCEAFRRQPSARGLCVVVGDRSWLPRETEVVVLHPLSPGDGVELLRTRCMQLDARRAREITRAFGGHPGALDTVGRYLDRVGLAPWEGLVAFSYDRASTTRAGVLAALADRAELSPDALRVVLAEDDTVLLELGDTVLLELGDTARRDLQGALGSAPIEFPAQLGLRWIRMARSEISSVQGGVTLDSALVPEPPAAENSEELLEGAADVYVLACEKHCPTVPCELKNHRDIHVGIVCQLRQQLDMRGPLRVFYDPRGAHLDRMRGARAAVLLICTHIARDIELCGRIKEVCRDMQDGGQRVVALQVDHLPVRVFQPELRIEKPEPPLENCRLHTRKGHICDAADVVCDPAHERGEGGTDRWPSAAALTARSP